VYFHKSPRGGGIFGLEAKVRRLGGLPTMKNQAPSKSPRTSRFQPSTTCEIFGLTDNLRVHRYGNGGVSISVFCAVTQIWAPAALDAERVSTLAALLVSFSKRKASK
jgi:hypothetical protein